MLHNLGCPAVAVVSPAAIVSTDEYGALLHTPGHVVFSLLYQGVVGEGPGAGGGAELLAGGGVIIDSITAACEEVVLSVAGPPRHHDGGQQARGEGGGEEHLR